MLPQTWALLLCECSIATAAGITDPVDWEAVKAVEGRIKVHRPDVRIISRVTCFAPTLSFCILQVPAQCDSVNCGIYALHFVEVLFDEWEGRLDSLVSIFLFNRLRNVVPSYSKGAGLGKRCFLAI